METRRVNARHFSASSASNARRCRFRRRDRRRSALRRRGNGPSSCLVGRGRTRAPPSARCRWRKGRARLFALPDTLRARVREIWRACPYPADPASFADFLHQIAVGKLNPGGHHGNSMRTARRGSRATRRRSTGLPPDRPQTERRRAEDHTGRRAAVLRESRLRHHFLAVACPTD